MDFQALVERAMHVRKLYEAKETELYGSPWTSEEIALGFVGDVGDLTKLIAAVQGKRHIADSQTKLEHTLADCLWSVIVLAGMHNVDLETSFFETMNRLEQHLLENR